MKDFDGKSQSERPLRLLCLHGHASNNDITQIQTTGLNLQNGLEHNCECDYIHAPHFALVPYLGLSRFSKGPWYTWGGMELKEIIGKSLSFFSQSSSTSSKWDRSMDYIAEYCKEHGPYDGVYGFSQGGAMITAFSNPLVWRDRFGMKECPWKFAILACAGGEWFLPEQNLLDLPSFHIKGMADWGLSGSTQLEKRWIPEKRLSYVHKGGHEIPLQILRNEPDLRKQLHSFITEMQKMKRERKQINESL